MPRAHGDVGRAVRHPVVGADLDADRVEADHRVEGHPEAGAATSGTAPAHRVGDLRDRPPAQDPRRWWTPEWWRISRAVIPPAYKPMIIASSPSILRWPMALPGAASSEPARSRGTTGLEGAHLASRWSWSWCRPRALAAGRGRRLSLLIAQVLGQLGPQAAPPEPPRGRAGSSPRAPVISTSPESICSNRPSRAPVSLNRRATSRPSTGLFLSSVALNRRQSFHQGLHRPLNTPTTAWAGRMSTTS